MTKDTCLDKVELVCQSATSEYVACIHWQTHKLIHLIPVEVVVNILHSLKVIHCTSLQSYLLCAIL